MMSRMNRMLIAFIAIAWLAAIPHGVRAQQNTLIGTWEIVEAQPAP